MKNAAVLIIFSILLPLSGCGLLKGKVSAYYLDKALDAARDLRLSPSGADQAFSYIEKAESYAPGAGRTVDVLEQLVAAAARSGCANALDLEAAALRKMIALNPDNWRAWQVLINYMAARKDLAGLADAAIAAGKKAAGSGDPAGRYCALLIQLNATAAAAPLLKEAARNNAAGDPASFFENASVYSSAVAKTAELSAETARLAAAYPLAKGAAHPVLAASAEAAAAFALKDTAEAGVAAEFTARAEADPSFKAAAEFIVRGNSALAIKEYAAARGNYAAALSKYPSFGDARYGLAETCLLEGRQLIETGGDRKAALKLYGQAYSEANELLKTPAAAARLPFGSRGEFLAGVYSLKAEAILGLRAAEGKRLGRKQAARLDTELKSARDESVRLSSSAAPAQLLAYRTPADGTQAPAPALNKQRNRPR